MLPRHLYERLNIHCMSNFLTLYIKSAFLVVSWDYISIHRLFFTIFSNIWNGKHAFQIHYCSNIPGLQREYCQYLFIVFYNNLLIFPILGHIDLMKKHYKDINWSSYDLPNVLKERGVDDPDKLPGFHYRDDALRLWQAINDFVKRMLSIYYKSDEDIKRVRSVLSQKVRKSWKPFLKYTLTPCCLFFPTGHRTPSVDRRHSQQWLHCPGGWGGPWLPIVRCKLWAAGQPTYYCHIYLLLSTRSRQLFYDGRVWLLSQCTYSHATASSNREGQTDHGRRYEKPAQPAPCRSCYSDRLRSNTHISWWGKKYLNFCPKTILFYYFSCCVVITQ